MKKYCVGLIALVVCSPLFADMPFKPPQMPTATELRERYPTIEKIEAIIANTDQGEPYFRAGIATFFEGSMTNIRPVEYSKEIKKKYNERAIELLENANRITPNNPYILGMLGSAYGVEVTFSSFPGLIHWANKCRAMIKRAVEIAPNNPEIRMIRLRCDVRFPYQYYASVKNEILEDHSLIQAWINQSKEEDLTENQMNYFIALHNELNYWVGYYFTYEVKNKDQAKPFLLTVQPGSIEYRQAQILLSKVSL